MSKNKHQISVLTKAKLIRNLTYGISLITINPEIYSSLVVRLHLSNIGGQWLSWIILAAKTTTVVVEELRRPCVNDVGKFAEDT